MTAVRPDLSKVTARPWHQGDMNVPESEGSGPIAECWILRADDSGIGFALEEADAAFIVYAANNIERVETRLTEARGWLEWALEALERAAPQVHCKTTYGDTFRKAEAFLAAAASEEGTP